MTELLRVTDDGLYCERGDFHIDPWRPVPRAVITHAHSDHARAGSGAYHATRLSLPLLRRRLGPDALLHGHEHGEPLRFGDVEVSLHPAGHILGSAQVRVEADGEVWVVSGDYKRQHDPTCAPFEVVPCDTFVTEATFALPVYRWAPGEDVARALWDWWQQNAAHGRASVVFCYALGKAQRLLAELRAFTDRAVYVHGAMESLIEAYREAGVEMLPTLSATRSEHPDRFAGELILATPSAGRTSWMRRFGDHRTAFASGWMRIRGIRRRRNYDHGFVLSDHADWPDLLRTIDETGARRVLATHGRTDVLVRHLRERGLEAHALETYFSAEEDEG